VQNGSAGSPADESLDCRVPVIWHHPAHGGLWRADLRAHESNEISSRKIVRQTPIECRTPDWGEYPPYPRTIKAALCCGPQLEQAHVLVPIGHLGIEYDSNLGRFGHEQTM